ncbi:MAG: hypothetical protein HY327_11825 [Chloroflexi bacterium]|nr:hypothetical protein [Chloroflexota bacterium]
MSTRRPSLIIPLILITAGVLLLLSNLGYLPLSFWDTAARFWPLIIIMIGVQIIFGRRSLVASLAIIALWVGLVGGALWFAFAQGSAPVNVALTSDAISEPLGEIKSAVINLDLGVSATTVKAASADSTDLVSGTYRHAEGMRIEKKYQIVGNEGRLSLNETGTFFPGSPQAKLDLLLSPRVPLQLNIDGGVGSATLDLSALNAPMIEIDGGVGSLALTTPQIGAMKIKVSGGVGNLQITIPPGVAARIRVNTGIGGTNVDTARFPKSGEYYQSADYAGAANRIDLDVNGGVGAIKIR